MTHYMTNDMGNFGRSMVNEIYTQAKYISSLSNAERKKNDEEEEKAKDVNVVHASSLGVCPHLKAAELKAEEGVSSSFNWKNRNLFLNDGHLHEEMTARYLQGLIDSGRINGSLVRNQRVPSFKVEIGDTKYTVIGEADMILTTEDGPLVIEHKAIRHKSFVEYSKYDKPAPKRYLTQLATYIKALKANGGFLIFKDRDTSELLALPGFDTLEEADAYFSSSIHLIEMALNGVLTKKISDECDWCPLVTDCFNLYTEGKYNKTDKTVVEINFNEETDSLAIDAAGIAYELSKAKKMEKIASDRAREYKKKLKTWMQNSKVDKLVSIFDNFEVPVTFVRNSGRFTLSKEAKKKQKELIEQGVLTQERSPGYSYLNVGKVVNYDEEESDKA